MGYDMQTILALSDFFEMVAALAALAVTYLMYREVRRTRDEDKS